MNDDQDFWQKVGAAFLAAAGLWLGAFFLGFLIGTPEGLFGG